MNFIIKYNISFFIIRTGDSEADIIITLSQYYRLLTRRQVAIVLVGHFYLGEVGRRVAGHVLEGQDLIVAQLRVQVDEQGAARDVDGLVRCPVPEEFEIQVVEYV